MVAEVRAGTSQRGVARAHGVGLATVQLWLARAGERPLDEVDWGDRSSAPLRTTRSAPELEELVLRTRAELRDTSVLGEYGARAVQARLRELLEPDAVPSLRTIGRIFKRSGAVDFRRRRQPAPPKGWYLAEVRSQAAELDSFDTIEGLHLPDGRDLTILTGISLHGGLPVVWPLRWLNVRRTVAALLEHWRDVGLPGFAQFDNDPRFAGSPGLLDSLGPVARLCLRLGVVPVFAPPHEHGLQNAIEGFNGRWQAKLWSRLREASFEQLEAASMRYVATVRRRAAARIEAAPRRRPFPQAHEVDPRAHLTGRLILVRRTGDAGEAIVLGRRFPVDRAWPHRLIRAEVDFDDQMIRMYGLQRRDPTYQPLLREVPYVARD